MPNNYTLPSHNIFKRRHSSEAQMEYLRLYAKRGLSKRFSVLNDNIVCRLEFELYLAASENAAEDVFILSDIINELEYKELLHEVVTDKIETSLLMYCLFLTNKNPMDALSQDCLMTSFKLQHCKINIEAKASPVIEEYLLCKFGKRKHGKRMPEIHVAAILQ